MVCLREESVAVEGMRGVKYETREMRAREKHLAPRVHYQIQSRKFGEI